MFTFTLRECSGKGERSERGVGERRVKEERGTESETGKGEGMLMRGRGRKAKGREGKSE